MSREQDAVETYARSFRELEPSLPGAGLAWLGELRQNAIERFTAAGFPNRKVEAFKYTDLARLNRTVFDPAPRETNGIARDALAEHLLQPGPCHLLVFVDGRYRADLSRPGELPAGVTLGALAEALEDEPGPLEALLREAQALDGDALFAFNTAFMRDGALVRLAAGVTLEAPVHLLYLARAEGAPAFPLRNLVVAGAESSATVLETYVGPESGSYWTSAVTQVSAGEGARLRHYKLQREGGEAIHLAATAADLGADSAYQSFVLSLGARLSRHRIAALLDGGGIDCNLNGAYLARGRQHVDNSILVDHARPGSMSREVYKGVLDERAHGVFHGQITVRPDAQRTDAHQLNRNLLLSESAQVDTKPELEIYADDVKCSHGATAGELSADAVFYLRSRGLDEGTARRLLVEAFVAEVVEGVEVEAVRTRLQRVVSDWLGKPEG